MSFRYERTIHFADTDAAGVVYFANFLSLCHEAYEEALKAAGIELGTFFQATDSMVPVVKSEAEYLRPLRCGDRIRVELTPERLDKDRFEVRYVVTRLGTVDKASARVRTEHVCISVREKGRLPLPPELATWVDGKTA